MKKTLAFLTALLALAACGGKEPVSTPTAPAAPTGLKVHAATESSLTFQWNVVEGAAAYDWQIQKDGATVDEGHIKTRNKTVDKLAAGTKYRFGVRAVGEDETLLSAWTYLEAETQSGSVTPDPGTDPTPDPSLAAKCYKGFLVPAHEEDGQARAFTGAEGGGMFTTGGRGGQVYHVTSLEDGSAEGTLRYGIEKGPRPLTIVFDVAGLIPLTKQLNITKGDLTIAGQTAPGGGICLKNYTFRISASNVIVRFIRCRMGDEKQTEDDAMQILSHDDDKYSDIIIDHCSVSWCTDECASFYGMKDFTFSWNIVSESLRNSVHGKGAHGYGGIWGGSNATYHHNLLAHHDSRNARIDHDYVSTQKGPVTLANNVIYNWSGNTTYGGESFNATGTFRQYNLVNNYYKPGPVTPSNHIWFLDPTSSCSNCTGLKAYPDNSAVPAGSSLVPGHFYMTGNYMAGKAGLTSDNWTGTTASASLIAKIKADAHFSATGKQGSISLQGAEKAFEAVLAYAGASFARDAVDTRVTDETRKGTFTYAGSARTDKDGKPLAENKWSTKGLIDTQTDVGGWPEYSSTTAENVRARDSDRDGMPDWFEEQFGLDKGNAADAKAKDFDAAGRYTNLEMYLHYLVRDIVAAQVAGGTYSQL